MSNKSGALAALTAAAQGLLVPSEGDYPLESFRWAGPGPLTPAALRAQLGLPPDAPAETRALDDFFAPLAATYGWMDDQQRAAAARFAGLRDLIAASLSDVTVYRLGHRRISAIIAGKDAAGQIVGLRTTQIET